MIEGMPIPLRFNSTLVGIQFLSECRTTIKIFEVMSDDHLVGRLVEASPNLSVASHNNLENKFELFNKMLQWSSPLSVLMGRRQAHRFN
jgi:hypothetical protein